MSARPTIHVVDDDNAVRDSLGLMLEVDGFAVHTYASSEAFLHSAHVDNDCCLIVDVHMPGLGGLDLVRLLRHRGVDIPAVVMTGRMSEALRHGIGQAHAILLEKPFRLPEVIDAIKAATGRDEI